MEQNQKIQNSVDNLIQNGWTPKQVNSAIQNLAINKPAELKKTFRSLVYFFAILPTNEVAVDNFNLVDIQSAFTIEEFKSLLFFLNEFQAGL